MIVQNIIIDHDSPAKAPDHKKTDTENLHCSIFYNEEDDPVINQSDVKQQLQRGQKPSAASTRNLKHVSRSSNAQMIFDTESKTRNGNVGQQTLQIYKKEKMKNSRTRTRSIKIIKKVTKAKEEAADLRPADAFERRRWTEYEVRKIKVDKHGHGSLQSVQNHERKPKEYIDFYDALSNLQAIRSNSQAQLERLRKSFSNLKEPYNTQDAIKATEAAVMPECRKLSKASGHLSTILNAENLTSINVIEQKKHEQNGDQIS